MPKINIPISSAVPGLLVPRPVVLVTCVDEGGNPNIIAIAAIAPASYKPLIFMIVVRIERYSHGLIEKSREFVINIPSIDLVAQTDFCGTRSGRNVDKFRETKLTAIPSDKVKAPFIAECPINIECKVVRVVRSGTHTIFLGRVVAVHVEEGLFDGRKLDLEKMPTIGYNYVEYRRPGTVIYKREE